MFRSLSVLNRTFHCLVLNQLVQKLVQKLVQNFFTFTITIQLIKKSISIQSNFNKNKSFLRKSVNCIIRMIPQLNDGKNSVILSSQFVLLVKKSLSDRSFQLRTHNSISGFVIGIANEVKTHSRRDELSAIINSYLTLVLECIENPHFVEIFMSQIV